MKYLPLPSLRLSGLATVLALAAASASTAATTAAAVATAATAGPQEQARVIVRFKPAAASVRMRALSVRMDAASAKDVAQGRASALAQRSGLASLSTQGLRARLSLDERTHVITATGIGSAELARRLAADGEVELAVVDHLRRHTVVPNDALYVGNGGTPPSSGNGSANGQWYLKAPSASVPSSINAPAAWDITTGSASVVVAVLDTGVRFDHPDLAGQFISSSAFSTGKVGYDMVGLSYANALAAANDGNRNDDDPSDPGDWVSQADVDGGALGAECKADSIGNSSWHGTRVSGLIAAASNNAQGIAGVGWGVKLLPVRVLGKCGGYDSDIMAGMLWAAGIAVPGLPSNPNPAKVLNMSLGSPSASPCTGSGSGSYPGTIAQVQAKGVTVVVAAGNSEGLGVGVPGNCPGVITVAALRHVGSKVGFSSLGPEVSIAAPGGNCVNTTGACLYPMLSSTNSGTTSPVVGDSSYTNSVASVGTSFSAPIVSGTVALMLSVNPTMSPTQVLSTLKSTARPFVTTGGSAGIRQCSAPTATVQDECYCSTSTCGAGMLDAAAAVAAAKASNPAATPQSISFAAPAMQTVVASSLTLNATASSGLTVDFSASPSTVCTVSGNSLALWAPGTCSVAAQQIGNSTFVVANKVVQMIEISQGAQTISFPAIATQTLGTTPPALSATASSGLTVSYSSTSTSVCTVSGSTLTLLAVGNCSITATQAGNAAYAAASPAAQTFAVVAAAVTTTSSGGGGGGGAFGAVWVALLGLASFVLRRGASRIA
ncbi:serine protease [Paucibacter oligotrophus]|uniref:Serine protease n=1 Tax=Roseateles oligotrophus TaxID=1769250 RepID=A0A840L330_9BURK|nr:S8 family peptidase [Roseateles oligotrophus]MBB4842894.1 serine protease [Roseateles oligotrophus]